MAVSQIASKIIETFGGINPNVKTVMVFFARSSAGLKCGKNFNNPNHKYTNAMLIAKGPMKIISEDGRFETSRNKAAFCRCGHSANKPFCDASHKACGFSSE